MPPASLTSAFREATAMALPPRLVKECLLPDDRFARAWSGGLDQLAAAERRGAICVETGTIAESVATLLLTELGLDVFAELAAAGVHGVDLLALTPAGQVLALEVKGTLRAASRPRLGRGRLRQMSLDWLSSPNNPAMIEWELDGADIYGGVAHLNFASMTWRVVLSHDLEVWTPLRQVEHLLDLRELE
jgi:hypothetical protein